MDILHKVNYSQLKIKYCKKPGKYVRCDFICYDFSGLSYRINIQEEPPPLQENQEVPKINQRNVLRILVNMHDQLLVNGEVLSDVRQLKSITKEFIENPTNDPHRSEKQSKYIDDLGENAMVSKGVVSLQNDRGTSYAIYIAVQNQLTMAFNELRDEYSQQRFGKPYEKISENQKKGVQKIYPISISEAEPSNYGGKK